MCVCILYSVVYTIHLFTHIPPPLSPTPPPPCSFTTLPPPRPQIPADGCRRADLCAGRTVQPRPTAAPLLGEAADGGTGACRVQPVLHLQRVLQAAGQTVEPCHQQQHPAARHVGHLGQGTAVDTRSAGVCVRACVRAYLDTVHTPLPSHSRSEDV